MLAPLSKLTVPLATSVLVTVALVVLIQPRTVGGIGLLFLIVTATVVILAALYREVRDRIGQSASAETSPTTGSQPGSKPLKFLSRRGENR